MPTIAWIRLTCLLFQFGIVCAFRGSLFFQTSTSRTSNIRLFDGGPGLSDVRELTKIFGRMSDKMLLLDVPGAGTPEMMNCCHGGCDNCDFSHVFDNMSAGRPKWVPTYSYRQLIDGRDHHSAWASIFDSEDSVLDETTFVDRIKKLPYQMNMGPPSSVPADEEPTDETLHALWSKLIHTLHDTSSEATTIDAKQMSEALVKLTGDSHGVMFSDFKKALAE